jgi:SAM-dependent methyltransferase
MLKIRNPFRRPIVIPAHLAVGHGGDQAKAIGEKCAETFELWGLLTGADRILDIGCGPGRLAIAIGERFRWRNRYLGFDIRAVDIEFCQREIARAHRRFGFVHADVANALYNPTGRILPVAYQFPTAAGSIDFAFATSVFTHMRTPEMLHYLAEVFRCLAPGGRLLASFFCLRDDVGPSIRPPRFRFDTPVDEHCWTSHPHLPEEAIAFRLDFLRDAFRSSNFVEVQFKPGAWPGIDGRHSQDYLVARRGA